MHPDDHVIMQFQISTKHFSRTVVRRTFCMGGSLLLSRWTASNVSMCMATTPADKGKGTFLYSAVSSPLDRSQLFTLFLPWQTCSFRHQLDFSSKHFSHAAITHEFWTNNGVFNSIYSSKHMCTHNHYNITMPALNINNNFKWYICVRCRTLNEYIQI